MNDSIITTNLSAIIKKIIAAFLMKNTKTKV
jgi:hypothetical protein